MNVHENNGTPATAESNDKRSTISRKEAFLISKWLRKNRANLESQKLDRAGVAAAVKAGMGIEVSESNLKGVCNDFDLEPMWTRREKRASLARPEDMMKRGQLSRLLAKQLLAVTAELERVCKLLGEEFDPGHTIAVDVLRSLARGKTVNAEVAPAKS